MKKLIIGAAALGVVIAAGAAWAGQNHHRMMGHMITARVEQAEDLIDATPAQRQVIDAAKDDIVAKVQARMEQRKGQAGALIDAFAADNLDTAKIYAMADQHAESIRETAKMVLPDLQKVHDVLTPAQRQKLAQHFKEMHGGHGW